MEVLKKLMNNKKAYVFIVAFLLIAAIAAAGLSVSNRKEQQSQPKQPQKAENRITGTGVLEAEQQFEVNANVQGEVLSAPFEEGQQIHAGDLLYVIKHTDLINNIEKTKLGIERAKLAYNQTADSISKLNMRSGIDGTITNLYIHEGDMIMQNAKIADVVNHDKMLLKVPFIDETTYGVYPGQKASVSIVGTFYTLDGTVKKVATGRMISSTGSVVKMVEIEVPNPGTLVKGDKGTAIIGNIACNDAGTFDYASYETVYAEVSGKVQRLSKALGDHVNSGESIAVLSNEALIAQHNQNSIAIQEANVTLDTLNEQLKNYNITSNIDGIAIKKNVKQGDTVSAANMNKMAVVADLSKIIFKMNVDEQDVLSIKVGQTVAVTVDAMPEKEYQGIVEFVSESGTLVNGVSLYEVKIGIIDSEGLMPGMNVTAKINIE